MKILMGVVIALVVLVGLGWLGLRVKPRLRIGHSPSRGLQSRVA